MKPSTWYYYFHLINKDGEECKDFDTDENAKNLMATGEYTHYSRIGIGLSDDKGKLKP